MTQISKFIFLGYGYRQWPSVTSFWSITGHLCGDSHRQHCNPNCGVSWLFSFQPHVFHSWPLLLPRDWVHQYDYELIMLKTLLSAHVPISFPDCTCQFCFVSFHFISFHFVSFHFISFLLPSDYSMLLPGCHVLIIVT